MKGKINILGCGWLGKPLAKLLQSKDFDVAGSCRTSQSAELLKENNITPILFDIDQIDNSIDELLNCDTLIISIPSKSVDGFNNLYKRLIKSNVKSVIYISSTSVYNEVNSRINEEAELKDGNLVSIENIFRHGSVPSIIIRFSGLIGEDRNPVNFFKNRKIPNPEGYVNFIHQDDCIQLISNVIEQKLLFTIINGSSDVHYTRREFYTNLYNNLGYASPEFEESEKKSYKIVDNTKSKSLLNYQYQHPDILKSFN